MEKLKISAAVLRELHQPWSLEEAELEAPRSDEIRVRMVGTGICHTDIICRDGFPVPMPIVLGHEGAGVVESVGSGVTGIVPGDHVLLSFGSCGDCPNCRKDEPAYCYHFLPYNFSGGRGTDMSSPISQEGNAVHGSFFCQSSFATYAIAKESNAVVIAKDLPLAIMGPLGCGIQTGAGAVANSLGLREGESLAVFGAGAVGLAAVMAAHVLKASTIVVVEPNAARRQMALELGAHHAIDPVATADVLETIRNLCSGVDYAFDTSGIPAVIGTAMEALLPGGMLGMVGAPPPDAMMPASLMSMLMRGVGAKYIIEGDSDRKSFIPRMIEWYRAGAFPFDRLVKTFPFADINAAIHAAESGAAIKPVLLFD